MQHLLVCPMMDTACSPQDQTRLTTSPSAVPAIGRAQFDGHTTPGGRTRMMMTSAIQASNVNTISGYLDEWGVPMRHDSYTMGICI